MCKNRIKVASVLSAIVLFSLIVSSTSAGIFDKEVLPVSINVKNPTTFLLMNTPNAPDQRDSSRLDASFFSSEKTTETLALDFGSFLPGEEKEQLLYLANPTDQATLVELSLNSLYCSDDPTECGNIWDLLSVEADVLYGTSDGQKQDWSAIATPETAARAVLKLDDPEQDANEPDGKLRIQMDESDAIGSDEEEFVPQVHSALNLRDIYLRDDFSDVFDAVDDDTEWDETLSLSPVLSEELSVDEASQEEDTVILSLQPGQSATVRLRTSLTLKDIDYSTFAHDHAKLALTTVYDYTNQQPVVEMEWMEINDSGEQGENRELLLDDSNPFASVATVSDSAQLFDALNDPQVATVYLLNDISLEDDRYDICLRRLGGLYLGGNTLDMAGSCFTIEIEDGLMGTLDIGDQLGGKIIGISPESKSGGEKDVDEPEFIHKKPEKASVYLSDKVEFLYEK